MAEIQRPPLLVAVGGKRDPLFRWLTPQWLVDAVFLFQTSRRSGSVTLHFKDGILVNNEDIRFVSNT